MSFEKIKILLQDNIGLYAGSIGDSSVDRAIAHRMDALKIEGDDYYLERLRSDQDELNELVEEVVVPETWFFRNSEPFETMVKCIPEINESEQLGDHKIRILSIPCSTGEEPYSIAITLLKNGIPQDAFQIDAIDISKRALKKARRAIYGKHSFRETDGVAESGYFQSTRSGQQVLPFVKKHVNFIEGNILRDTIAPEPEYYDIIFCRNLLIYFNRETQKQALEKLNTILKKNGTLFMGHAETTDANKNLFTRLDIPRSFAYKKKIMTENMPIKRLNNEPIGKLEDIYNQLVDITLRDIELSKKYKQSLRSKKRKIIRKNHSLKNANIFNVEKLIKQGNLAAASKLCEKWLEEEPEEAQGYYLLGLISSLEGNTGSADSLLKKAIYLNPNHHKALGLSAFLAEQRGDNINAESLRFRESRAKQRSK